MPEEPSHAPLSPNRLPVSDVEIGGRGYICVQDVQSGPQHLLPADDDLSSVEAAKHYRRSSEVLDSQLERKKVPWQQAGDPGFTPPENLDAAPGPFRASTPTGCWLRPTTAPTGTTAGAPPQAPRQPADADVPTSAPQVITVLLWRQHWRTYVPARSPRPAKTPTGP